MERYIFTWCECIFFFFWLYLLRHIPVCYCVQGREICQVLSSFFFIGYFMYLHLLCYVIPLPSFPLSSLSSPCFYEDTPPPSHPLPPQHPGEMILHRTKGFSSYWCQTIPSPATYMVEATGPSMCALWLVVYSLGTLGGGLVRWYCCSSYGVTNPFSFFSPPLGSPCSVWWLAATTLICISKAVAEPLRRHPYQAPVSKHFLASATVTEFGGCIWDGSPGGAVSGWPFLQSLLHSLSLYFLLWVFCSSF